MNVVIEYVLRNRRIEQMLTLPCSLFLESRKKGKTRLVVTIAQGYGIETLLVRHYFLSDSSKDEWMPPFTEYYIPSKEIFTSKEVVIPGYKPLPFQEQPWDSDAKQVTELPLGAIQERQYGECLTNFFNPKVLLCKRENWLWESFDKVYIPEDLHNKVHPRIENGREQILRLHKSVQRLWDHWKKYLLLSSNISSELAFTHRYKRKILSKTKKRKSMIEELAYFGVNNI